MNLHPKCFSVQCTPYNVHCTHCTVYTTHINFIKEHFFINRLNTHLLKKWLQCSLKSDVVQRVM